MLSAREYDALLRQDLAAFIQRTFLHLNPGRPYQHNWHIEVIAAKLRDCFLGRTRRLIINLPPRYLKSISASIAFPAWVLGHRPAANIVCVSYAQDLADKLARDCRNVIQSDWYQRLFGLQLSSDRNATREFTTTAQGYRLATSVGGVLTGRGGDFLIIDDPLRPDEAVSDVQRRRVNEWYDGTLIGRQNEKKDSTIILIMQRLHEDDLVGHMLEQEPWECVTFPAIAEHDATYRVDTPWGERTLTRKAGDVLHPEREPRALLDQIRGQIGEYHFAGQYQQTPAPLGGGMVKVEWFVPYREDRLPVFEQILQSWDTANKPGELSDYSVCTTWGLADKHLYVLDVFRERLDYPRLKQSAKLLAQRFRPNVLLIEDKAAGTQLIQELRAEGCSYVQAYEPKCDKIMRMHAQTAKIASGFVHVPETAPWLPVYLHELTTFPHAKYDDQVDSSSQLLEWVQMGQGSLGLLEFYREWGRELGITPRQYDEPLLDLRSDRTETDDPTSRGALH